MDLLHTMRFIRADGLHGDRIAGMDQLPHESLMFDGHQRYAARIPNRAYQRNHHIIWNVKRFNKHLLIRLNLRRMPYQHLREIVISRVVHECLLIITCLRLFDN